MQDPAENKTPPNFPDTLGSNPSANPTNATVVESNNAASAVVNGVNQVNSNVSGSGGTSYFKKHLVPIIGVFIAMIGVGVGVFSVADRSGKKPEISVASTNSTDPHLREITSRGTLRIGTDATYPPMEFLDNKENLVGYDIDLGDRIADKLNLTAEFVNIKWDDLFTSLEEGKIDMIISSITITDERKAKYDFSSEYLNAGQVIIIRKDNTVITSTADLRGKKIAVQKETTNETEALKYTENDMVLRYDDFIGATNALIDGKADAIFSDLTNAKGIVNENPTLKIASEPFTQEFYGIVLRKGDTKLLSNLNDSLEILRQQGVLVYLKQKWLEQPTATNE